MRGELSWDMRTGDVDVFREDNQGERTLVSVVKDVEMMKVRMHGEVVLRHAEGTVTVYDVRIIRYVSPLEVNDNETK